MVGGYAALITANDGEQGLVDNSSFPAATSGDVLSQFQDPVDRATIANSDVAVVMVGADDFWDATQHVLHGRDPVAEFTPVAQQLTVNLRRIVAEVREVHHGERVPVILCDYWNIYKDGTVAQHTYTQSKREVSTVATQYANAAIRRAAQLAGVDFVSTWALFHDGHDIDTYLGPDGNHPNAQGYAMIAEALYRTQPRPPADRLPGDGPPVENATTQPAADRQPLG
jgi:lysophospholipase L1-like esterase